MVEQAVKSLSIPEGQAYLEGLRGRLFPAEYRLLPQMRQIYELELAYAESRALTDQELVSQAAYFQSIDGQLTNHFRICRVTPNQVNASAKQERKNFFAANVFAVGYATHGLFPYRGKFHAQMIKAVMNVIGLRQGNIVLDPMAGCGTTMIEAAIMGIHSIGVELSPFTCLMSQAKLGALRMDCSSFRRLLESSAEILDYFDDEMRQHRQRGLPVLKSTLHRLLEGNIDLKLVLQLCYLDAMGYARRRKNKNVRELFLDVLNRYFEAISAFNTIREELELELGLSRVIQGDARRLPLKDQAVDGIVFSPPYSFAIDYVENDRPQLEYLGVSVDDLKSDMVGLSAPEERGRASVRERVSLYFEDMERILRECERVLKEGRYCVVVIGSNTRQTGGILLEEGIVERAENVGLTLKHQIVRDIEGIRNTMRQEYILFFEKS